MDVGDETSPGKVTSVEGENKIAGGCDQNSDDIKAVNIGKKSDLQDRKLCSKGIELLVMVRWCTGCGRKFR